MSQVGVDNPNNCDARFEVKLQFFNDVFVLVGRRQDFDGKHWRAVDQKSRIGGS